MDRIEQEIDELPDKRKIKSTRHGAIETADQFCGSIPIR
jgi:hypothetical protein